MPTYQYACTQCGQRLEVVQRFTDATLTECANCQGRLRKVFSPVGVVFKGSGFYRTDNRTKPSENGSAAGDARGSRSNGEAGAHTGGTTDKSGNGSSEKGSSEKGRSEKGSAGGDRASETGSSSTSSGSSTRGGSTSAMPTTKTA